MSGQYLGIDGERESGQDVREANVTAAGAIANVVKSSLGPVGLDKMLVDQIGDVTITNDGATILKQLEVEHPATKVLVELSVARPRSWRRYHKCRHRRSRTSPREQLVK